MKLLLGSAVATAVVAAAAAAAANADSPLSCSDGTSCNVTNDVIFGYGEDISTTSVKSAADCCAACNQNPRCQAWNIDPAAASAETKSNSGDFACWLHSGTTAHPRKGAVSAVRNTPLPPPTKDGWYPCANADASRFKFCDTSLDLEDRLSDLVSRIATAEAGSQLTARQSPSIPSLDLPSYYWGTNAIHGIQNTQCIGDLCPTSFPAPCGLAATFNMSVVKDMGAVIGRELRAYWNEQQHNSLDTWSPTININRSVDGCSSMLALLCVSMACSVECMHFQCLVRRDLTAPVISLPCLLMQLTVATLVGVETSNPLEKIRC